MRKRQEKSISVFSLPPDLLTGSILAKVWSKHGLQEIQNIHRIRESKKNCTWHSVLWAGCCGGFGQRLDSTIVDVFSNLNDSLSEIEAFPVRGSKQSSPLCLQEWPPQNCHCKSNCPGGDLQFHWDALAVSPQNSSPRNPWKTRQLFFFFFLQTSQDHCNFRQRQQHTSEVSTHQTQSSSSVSPVQRKFPSVLGYHKYFHTCDVGIIKIIAICWTYRIIYSLSILYLFPNQSCLSRFTAWLLNFPLSISTCSCSACWGGGRNCWALVALSRTLPNTIFLLFLPPDLLPRQSGHSQNQDIFGAVITAKEGSV